MACARVTKAICGRFCFDLKAICDRTCQNGRRFKATISTGGTAIDLTELFSPEFVHTNSHAVGFQLSNGDEVAVLASKSSPRYRIVSSCFEAAAVVLNLLIKNLEHNKLEGTFDEQLPLSEYFRIIDRHFEHRVMMSQLQSDLEVKAHQFRVVQKRLLMRFKDKSPAPLQHLDTLLETRYDDLLAIADGLKDGLEHQRHLFSRLSASGFALVLLMRLKFRHLAEQDLDIISNTLGVRWLPTPEQGWEETVDSGLLFLLRTTLSKDDRDMPTGAAAAPKGIPADTSKLKKHISAVCEKMLKGLRPSGV